MTGNSGPFKAFEPIEGIGNLNGKYKTDWVEGNLDIEEDPNGKLSFSHTKNYIGASIGARRVDWFFRIILLLFIIFFSRIFYLQIIKGNYYGGLAEGNRVRFQPIPAERGQILDRNGKEFLRNIPGFYLSFIPQDLPRDGTERDLIIARLTELSGLSSGELYTLVEKYSNYTYESLTIKENLDYQTALRLYIQNANQPGFLVESGSKRSYLNTSSTLSLSHLLGYLGKLDEEELKRLRPAGYLPSDNIGKTGLEQIYEEKLRGKYGRKKIEVNAAGKEQNVLAVEPPTPGKNLYLSIDLEAQKEMEKIVKSFSDRSGKKRIAAVALNPKNGEIIAMVSWPAFNNNDFIGGITQKNYNQYLNNTDHPLFNRAIGGTYPPGSTIKLVVGAAALEEGVATRNTWVKSTGGILVGGHLFKDWQAGGHGSTNIIKALSWSVNTFFYYVGGGYEKFNGLGLERLIKYFKLFQMATLTGIDLPGENTGFVPDNAWKEKVKQERWYVGDTYNLSIGQGDLLVTPLQVAAWTAATASGRIITPHLGKKLIDPVSKKEEVLEFTSRDTPISPSNLEIIRAGMRECVVSGSCQQLAGLPFATAGKTGTAQWSTQKQTHSWFTSYAPYNNPSIVVTVLVEEGGEGGAAALPIARAFYDWWGKKYLTER